MSTVASLALALTANSAGLKGSLAEGRSELRSFGSEARDVQRTFEQTRTPVEAFEIRVDSLNKMLNQGKISFETWDRAAAQARERLANASEAGGEGFGLREGLETFGAIELVRRSFDQLKESFEGLNQVSRTAEALGLSPAAYAKLGYAADVAHVPVDTLSSSIARMLQNLGGGAEGENMQRLTEAVADLRLNISDLVSGDPLETFEKIADALRRQEDPFKRAADASAIFGRQWRDLNPLLREGKTGLEELFGDAVVAGIVRTKEEYDKLESAERSVTAAQKALQGGVADLVISLSPALKGLADFTKAHKDGVVEALGFAAAAGSIVLAMPALTASYNAVSGAMSAMWANPVMTGGVAALALIADEVYHVASAWDSASTGMGAFTQGSYETVRQLGLLHDATQDMANEMERIGELHSNMPKLANAVAGSQSLDEQIQHLGEQVDAAKQLYDSANKTFLKGAPSITWIPGPFETLPDNAILDPHGGFHGLAPRATVPGANTETASHVHQLFEEYNKLKKELDELRARARDVESSTQGTGKAAHDGAGALEKMKTPLQEMDRLAASIKEKIATFGQAAADAEIYKLQHLANPYPADTRGMKPADAQANIQHYLDFEKERQETIANVQKLQGMEDVKRAHEEAARVEAQDQNSIAATIARLKEQAETYGMNAEQIEIYKLMQLGATEAEIAQAQALQQQLDHAKQLRDAMAGVIQGAVAGAAAAMPAEHALGRSREFDSRYMGLSSPGLIESPYMKPVFADYPAGGTFGGAAAGIAAIAAGAAQGGAQTGPKGEDPLQKIAGLMERATKTLEKLERKLPGITSH